MRLKYLAIFSLLFVLKGYINAQEEIRFNRITTDNGLSSNVVNPILQDSAGYLWFGTVDGLCRYDGNSMEVYRHKNHDSNSLSENEILCLCEDLHHFIWAGTDYGLSCFNPISKKFTDYYFDKWSKNPRNNSIRSIVQGIHRFLWVGTYKGLYRMNIDSGLWMKVEIAPSNSVKMNIRELTATSEGRLFVATDSGLFCSDNDGKSFNPVLNLNRKMEGKHFSTLYLDNKERLWIGVWENSIVYELDSKTLQLKEYVFDTTESTTGLGSNSAHAIRLLNDSLLMIGAIISGVPESGGLYQLNLKTGKTHRYNYNNHDPYSLSSNHIYSIYTDKQKTIWLGTAGGVNYFNYRQLNFHELKPPDVNDSLVFAGYDTWLANAGRNTFWIVGSDGNLYNYSIPLNISAFPKFNGKLKLPKVDSYLRSIYPLGDSVLMGTSKGLLVLKTDDFNNPSLTIFPANPINREDISKIMKDDKGNFWVATNSDGVYEYTPSKQEIQHYLYKDEAGVINVPSGNIDAQSLAQDKQGNIWIGTGSNGFCCIHVSSGKVEWNKYLDKHTETKSLGEVVDIYCDTNNIVYMATTRAGLLEIDSKKEILNCYTVDEGLSNDDIAKIIPGDKNYLWLPTKKGLSCFDKATKKFRNYFKANGLLSDVFSFTGGIYNSGKIIFNSTTCIQYFDPASLLNSSIQVFPEFTSMEVNNKEYTGDLSQKISLGYRDNIVSFTFSAFDFINNAEDKFAYKLEGLDEDWNYCGSRRYAEYTNLPGGNYILKLKVQTTDGVWVETARPILLHIATPYWKTWWFFMLCGIAAFTLGYLFYYLKMQRKIEAEKLRTRLARDLHDDIGSSLSSISILSDMAVKNTATSPEETQLIFNKISESSHKTMESMKDIVWTVNPENDAVESLLTRMRIYCSEILEPKGIEYDFKADKDLEDVKLAMEQRRNFYLIFKETVNNIAKYSKCNKASITIYKSDDKIGMKITDNGIGFNTINARNKGNGLKNMNERAKLMNGNFAIESVAGKGTTTTLVFPLT